MDCIVKILHLLDILHQIIVDLFFSHFGLASPELIGVKFCHKQTDRQIIDSVYGGKCAFLMKFATSLLTLLAGGLQQNELYWFGPIPH